METMAALARTAPPHAGSTRRPSCALRPTASLSFAAAATTPRGRLGLGLSTAAAGSGRVARARAVPSRKIVASSEVEQSYIMIKPDGVQRGLVGEIISRFEKKGFLLKGLKLFQCPQDLAQSAHKQRDVHTASNIQSRTERLGTERRQEVYQTDVRLRQRADQRCTPQLKDQGKQRRLEGKQRRREGKQAEGEIPVGGAENRRVSSCRRPTGAQTRGRAGADGSAPPWQVRTCSSTARAEVQGCRRFRQAFQEHYKDLKDRPFFPKLIDYIISGPVVCMAWEGDGVVASGSQINRSY